MAGRRLPRSGDLRLHRTEAFAPVILVAIGEEVNITLVELAELLEREHAARFAPSTIWRLPSCHRVTLKKLAHAGEQQRPTWCTGSSPGSMRGLISIPSTWSSSTKVERTPKWLGCAVALLGSALPSSHFTRPFETTTFVRALRLSGTTALMLLDSPMNGAAFFAYVQQVLAPTLDARNTIVME